MKKLFLIAVCFLSLKSFSQDSIKITLSIQVRDIEYFTQLSFNDDNLGELFDSSKIKFRIPVPPTGLTNVSITGYTTDFIHLYSRLNMDAIALKGGCTSRLRTLLNAVGQTYLTNKLTAIDTEDTNLFQAGRQFGRFKLYRKVN
jgi:hypothetical protein